MKLNAGTDFSFRMLTMLAVNNHRWVPVSEIAKAYNLSQNHLSKISKTLINAGILETKRGRDGGLRIAIDPTSITLGEIIEIMEPDQFLVNCKGGIGGTCTILPACHLVGILANARKAFFASLNNHTLADVVPNQKTAENLKKLLTTSPQP